MKKLVLIFMPACVLVACNTKQPVTETKAGDSTAVVKKETLKYPYTPKYSIDWQPGDENNAVIVLTSLKKYTEGDVAGATQVFGDTVELAFDKYMFKGPRDSVKAMFTKERSNYTSMVVEPDSWQTVYFPDKKDTWVTVWYKQKWTDKKGKTDSAYCADDVLIKDGKIVLIDSKQRLYPVAKK